ncbi:hypothetical protein ACJRPK_14545 [Aquimarina sp. 2-A2]|uniref:hypothetical protein n=1 Tax=Aquimarina sp. 2-A2 TaxID=3382644 RepID=UPI00387F0527
MMKKLIFWALVIGFFAVSCSNDDDNTVTVNAGTIAGGPFEFDIDGEADFVTGITLDDTNASGANSSWVITDESGKILGLPPTLEAVENVDFDGAGPGTCLIWYLRFEDGLQGAEVGLNANDLIGNFDLSNSISVLRNQVTNAGTISGGPFEFDIDGEADFVTGITLDDSNAFGKNSSWVVTDDQGKILGLPPTLEALEAVNFDGAGPGTCLIWYLRFEDGLLGAEVGMNANDLEGDFDLSNSLTVLRNQVTNAGIISGGPFNFTIDGQADYALGIVLDDTNVFGTNSSWVITDDQGNILGLPPTLSDVEGVNFDEAGAGVCLIWYIRFEDDLQGAEIGLNANDLVGTYDLSNALEVVRTCGASAGTISGGPFNFVVDGNADFVSNIVLDTSSASGTNSTWVITDTSGTILGVPPTLADVKMINFDDAGPGTCLIWYLRFENGLEGCLVGSNANDLEGCYALSNAIEVIRN